MLHGKCVDVVDWLKEGTFDAEGLADATIDEGKASLLHGKFMGGAIS